MSIKQPHVIATVQSGPPHRGYLKLTIRSAKPILRLNCPQIASSIEGFIWLSRANDDYVRKPIQASATLRHGHGLRTENAGVAFA
ncbi:MAG: hypothetical protein ABI268_07885 [Rhodanobacter sp.]